MTDQQERLLKPFSAHFAPFPAEFSACFTEGRNETTRYMSEVLCSTSESSDVAMIRRLHRRRLRYEATSILPFLVKPQREEIKGRGYDLKRSKEVEMRAEGHLLVAISEYARSAMAWLCNQAWRPVVKWNHPPLDVYLGHAFSKLDADDPAVQYLRLSFPFMGRTNKIVNTYWCQ